MNIQRAIKELEQRDIVVVQMSTIIETDPVGGPPQGKYLNAVIECLTKHSPESLLAKTSETEILLGRLRTVKDGPRVIDIDILLYDQLKVNLPHLIIPHPRMHTRNFVLDPLKEIAPQLFK